METIQIVGAYERRPVPVLHAGGGLAVVKIGDWPRYSVSHVGSGLAVCISTKAGALRTPEEALSAMRAALTLPVDWTADPETIKDALGDEGQRLLKSRLRIAAHPPRGNRWRGFHPPRWRRPRPYEAEMKRWAIRDTRDFEYLNWSDVYPLRWRTDWIGNPVRPVRQPCRRFVCRAGAASGEQRRFEPTTTTPAPGYELLYDEQGAFIGLREHQTTHSPAGLATLAGRLRQAEAEAAGLRMALQTVTDQAEGLARALAICRGDRSRLAAARAWVSPHAQHPPSCGRPQGGACTCGLAELRDGFTIM